VCGTRYESRGPETHLPKNNLLKSRCHHFMIYDQWLGATGLIPHRIPPSLPFLRKLELRITKVVSMLTLANRRGIIFHLSACFFTDYHQLHSTTESANVKLEQGVLDVLPRPPFIGYRIPGLGIQYSFDIGHQHASTSSLPAFCPFSSEETSRHIKSVRVSCSPRRHTFAVRIGNYTHPIYA
jgi:hypothetical protein